ncbi:MAG TPA: DUF1653 domain-containing protein [Candidatus Paceibacterota bacterium]|nr:DUF1653 domain-containing protein [Candidatus Paceibacterota bacterium]
MAHTPAAELKERLTAAATQIEIGGRYAHYKHPEQSYRVVTLALLEADESVAVVYEQEGTDLTFIRPLTSFLETVESENGVVPRFQKL